MKLKLNVTWFLSQISNLFRKILTILFIVLSIGSGFVIGYYYDKLSESVSLENETKYVRSLNETSIAINEKNQLLIMDRTSGSYRIYEDSVGVIIFTMYTNREFLKHTK